MRLFFAGFFILGTAMYLSFGSRAGWNGLRVLTLAGYSWVSLVQTYFTLKQWLGCHKS
jgi:hypothetical protein